MLNTALRIVAFIFLIICGIGGFVGGFALSERWMHEETETAGFGATKAATKAGNLATVPIGIALDLSYAISRFALRGMFCMPGAVCGCIAGTLLGQSIRKRFLARFTKRRVTM